MLSTHKLHSTCHFCLSKLISKAANWLREPTPSLKLQIESNGLQLSVCLCALQQKPQQLQQLINCSNCSLHTSSNFNLSSLQRKRTMSSLLASSLGVSCRVLASSNDKSNMMIMFVCFVPEWIDIWAALIACDATRTRFISLLARDFERFVVILLFAHIVQQNWNWRPLSGSQI